MKKETLKKRYSDTRKLRDIAVDDVKRFRLQIAKYTFADLESGGQNRYIVEMKRREKKFTNRFKLLEKKLNKWDRVL